MIARTASLGFALIALGSGLARADLPSVSFDESRQHVYWCGTPLHSPLLFTVVAGTMRVNGLAPRRIAADTTSQEQEAQRMFGSVPEVQRMHVHGYPYRAAEDMLGWILARMARRVRAAYIQGLPQGPTHAHAAAMAAIDTSMVDLSRPVSVDSLSMRFTPRGLNDPVLFSGNPGTIQGLQGAAPPPATEADVAARVETLRKTLTTPGPLVLLMDSTTDKSISGAQALEAQRALQALISRTRAGETVEYGPEHILLGHHAFDLVVDAARKP